MASEFFVGWELMYHSVEKDVKTKEDVIMVLIHWVLIKSRFRCIGLGDDSTFTVDEPGSELLPKGWNTKDTFAIKYTLDCQLFILRGLNVDEEFIINLVRVADKKISALNLRACDVVLACGGGLEAMVPTCGELGATVRAELVAPLVETVSREASTQTLNTRPPASAAAPDRLLGRSPSADIESQRGRYADPFGVGSSDLNPFAPPGQGSIFDPFNRDPFNPLRPLDPGAGVPGGLPRGAVPPGARFDPINPLGIGPRPPRRQFPPDSDDLPPPGFDNMFM